MTLKRAPTNAPPTPRADPPDASGLSRDAGHALLLDQINNEVNGRFLVLPGARCVIRERSRRPRRQAARPRAPSSGTAAKVRQNPERACGASRRHHALRAGARGRGLQPHVHDVARVRPRAGRRSGGTVRPSGEHGTSGAWATAWSGRDREAPQGEFQRAGKAALPKNDEEVARLAECSAGRRPESTGASGFTARTAHDTWNASLSFESMSQVEASNREGRTRGLQSS